MVKLIVLPSNGTRNVKKAIKGFKIHSEVCTIIMFKAVYPVDVETIVKCWYVLYPGDKIPVVTLITFILIIN